jgi:Mg-chelatase subunit ChlD
MKRLTLDVPRWTIYQHRAARGLDQVDSLDHKRVQFEDELFDRLANGDEVEALPAEKADPKLTRWAKGVHDACNALPAFQRMADQIRSLPEHQRAAMAGMAVEQLMGDLGPALRDEERAQQGGLTPPKSMDPGEVKKFEDGLRRLTRKAVQCAQETVEGLIEAEAALDQFAFGWQPGDQPGEHAAAAGERTRQIANALKTKPRMQRLVQLIGRFRKMALTKQKQKVRHGADEIADITVGDDISRFLPTELAKLMHPLSRLDLHRQMMERSVLQYEMRGTETKGKGPMVVCLDKSGSMKGDPNDWATAVALALGDLAVRDGRVFAVVSFDTRIMHEAITKKGEKMDASALFVECHGGTDIDVAYERALQIIQQNPGQLAKADIVMITDGGSNQNRTAALREQAKALGVNSFGMAIGVNAECLSPWCDTVETIEQTYGIDDDLATKLFAA